MVLKETPRIPSAERQEFLQTDIATPEQRQPVAIAEMNSEDAVDFLLNEENLDEKTTQRAYPAQPNTPEIETTEFTCAARSLAPENEEFANATPIPSPQEHEHELEEKA